MSLTCVHTIAAARRHPECEGCNAVPTDEVLAAQEWDRRDYARQFNQRPVPFVPIEINERTVGAPRPVPLGISDLVDRLKQRLASASALPPVLLLSKAPAPRAADLVTVEIDANSTGHPLPLFDRDPSPEDLEAERDLPRPGVWAGEHGADLRALTQDETDVLIRAELAMSRWGQGDADEVARAVGYGDTVSVRFPILGGHHAKTQRGGIDSDPLVRVLARRAWGDRDREWFELRGVRKGEAVALVSDEECAVAWQYERVLGTALDDGRPGALVIVQSMRADQRIVFSVSDRLRDPPEGESADHIARREVGRVYSGLQGFGPLPPGARVTDSSGRDYRVIGVDADTFRLTSTMADSYRSALGLFDSRHRAISELLGDVTRDDQTRRSFGEAVAKAPSNEYAASSAYAPGARRPGYKPAPPTPRWARKRRDRSQPRGGR